MKKPESVLVLDLGSSYIKLVEAQIQDTKPFIKTFSVTPVPHELRAIESINTPSYIDFIRKLITQRGISAKDTVLCISHPQLEVKNLILPRMSPNELKESIKWEIRDAFSVPIEEVVVDYAILGEQETHESKKMELCVAVVPNKVAREYISLLQSLGLNPLSFVLEPETSYQCLKDTKEFKDKKVIVLINLGAEKTISSVFEDSKLKLMRNLSVFGNRFTESIASRVKTTDGEGLSIEKAEIIKCKYGIPAITEITEENIRPQDIFSALRPSLEDLVSELTRFLEYYKSEHEGRNIETVAIYGGTSMLCGFSEYISKNIGIPVILPNIVNAGSIDSSGVQKEEFTKFGAFLVNGIGGVLVRDKSINLLPPEIKEQKQLKYEKGRWIKIWISLMAAFLMIYMPVSFSVWLKCRALTKLKIEYEKFSLCKEELDRYNTIVDKLNRKMTLCNKLLQNEPFWEDLLKELTSLVPDNIVIKELSFSTTEERSSGSQKLPLTIAGIAYKRDSSSEDALTQFLQNLEKSRYFNKIKLEFSKEGKIEEEIVLEFKIGCDIKKL